MSRYLCPSDFSSHSSVVVDTFAQVLVGRVVGEPSEFILDGLGEVRVFDDRILSHFAREFRIEVGNVQHGFLEREHVKRQDRRTFMGKRRLTTLGLNGG